MGNNKPLLAHLCLFGSGAFWGLMAPLRYVKLLPLQGVLLSHITKTQGVALG